MKRLMKILAVSTLVVAAFAAVRMGFAQNQGSRPILAIQNAPAPARLPTSQGGRPITVGAPLAAVDDFVKRSRNETNQSIQDLTREAQALNREAEAIRNRLAQVEAALERWRAIADDLAHDRVEVGGQGPKAQTPALPSSPALEGFFTNFDPKIPAPGPSLEGKRVVLLTNVASGASDHDDLRRDLTREVVSSLRENVKHVKIVDSEKVAAWVEAHPDWTDPSQPGMAFESDFVVLLDVSKFKTEDPSAPDLLQGMSNIHIQAWELAHPKDSNGRPWKNQPKEGRKVYEDEADTTFPVRGPIPRDAGISPTSFRSKFVKVVATQISRHFHEHAPNDDLQNVKFNPNDKN